MHGYSQGRVSLGMATRSGRPMYGTTARCSCGWKYRTNETPSGTGGRYAREAHTTHVSKVAGTIERRQVTWTRWDSRRNRQVTTHPVQWIWTDPEGIERSYDTKREALTAREGQGS